MRPRIKIRNVIANRRVEDIKRPAVTSISSSDNTKSHKETDDYRHWQRFNRKCLDEFLFINPSTSYKKRYERTTVMHIKTRTTGFKQINSDSNEKPLLSRALKPCSKGVIF
jgi:hypothetical protein